MAQSRSTPGPTESSRTKVGLCGVVTAVLVLVLAGCASDEDESVTTTVAPTVTAPSAMLASPVATSQATPVASPMPSPVASPISRATLHPDALALGVGGGGTIPCGRSDGTAGIRPRSTTPDRGTGLVTVATLDLHSGPGNDCPVVAALGFGTTLDLREEMVGQDGRLWRRVVTQRGAGYAAADAVAMMPARQPAAIPILMYHDIVEDGDPRFNVTPTQLDAQLRWLRLNGYVSITPIDLHRATRAKMPLPEKPVMLTIDDGNPSTMTFKALLDRYGFRGVYFLPNYAPLPPTAINELAASGEVCGHTVTHAKLSELSPEEQRAEIVDNKRWLERLLGVPVTCFAFPFGAYNDVTDDLLAEAGYQIAFNAWGGSAVLTEIDRWHVHRREVYGTFSLDEFAAVVEGTH